MCRLSGFSVVTVNASDLDAGLNAHIDYVIRSGSADNFLIDLNSGLITVAPNADLDIDVNGDMYTVLVIASQLHTCIYSYTSRCIHSMYMYM